MLVEWWEDKSLSSDLFFPSLCVLELDVRSFAVGGAVRCFVRQGYLFQL